MARRARKMTAPKTEKPVAIKDTGKQFDTIAEAAKAIEVPKPRKAREPKPAKVAEALNLDTIIRALEAEAASDRKAFYSATRPNGNDRALRLREELAGANIRLNALIMGV